MPILYKSVRFVLFTKTSFIANVSRIIYSGENSSIYTLSKESKIITTHTSETGILPDYATYLKYFCPFYTE